MLIYLHKSSEERAAAIRTAFAESLGTANDPAWPLPNLKPSTDLEFWAQRASYAFDAEAWVSPQRINEHWSHLLLYFCMGGHLGMGGFAVVHTYQSQQQKVAYYRWSKCEHQFQHATIGNCLHLYTCSKCGHAYQVDSGD